jgi:hypothetical protein
MLCYSIAMLNTEILSALKKANFPLKRIADLLSEIGLPGDEEQYSKLFPNSFQIAGKWYLQPTVEQLLTALGDSFRLLERTGQHWTAMNKTKVGRGTSAVEALANLFLEVQK